LGVEQRINLQLTGKIFAQVGLQLNLLREYCRKCLFQEHSDTILNQLKTLLNVLSRQ